jgi:hypothetical protein
MRFNTKVLRIVVLVFLVAGALLFALLQTWPGKGLAERRLRGNDVPANFSARRQRDEGDLSAHCFKGQVLWHPSKCSVVDSIIRDLDASTPLSPGSSTWTIAIAGSGTNGAFRVAEANAVLGDTQHSPWAIGASLLRRNTTQTVANFCGECCECVAELPSSDAKHAERGKGAASVGRRILFVNTGLAADLSLGPSVEMVVSDGDCASVAAALAARLRADSTSLDVLSLETFGCDAFLVRQLVVAGYGGVALRPQLLQFSMWNATEGYADLVEALAERGGGADYLCYFLTMKPVHKSFRGIRVAPYPVAVLATGCWRASYNNFRADRHLVTCHAKGNERLRRAVETRLNQWHRGSQIGCSSGLRQGRLRALTNAARTNVTRLHI